jgi:mannosyltransferase
MEDTLQDRTPSSKRGKTSKLIVVIALFLMMVFSALLSLFVFSETSLRLDEAQSLFQTNRDVPGLLRLVAQDVHVPLYHLLLHLDLKIFGSDIFTARMLSLVFFLLTIPATYLLGSYTFKRRIGLFAAFLVAITPFTNWYGSEARMYAMLAFITVLHQYLFLKVFREGKAAHWLLYALTAIIGIYTHYFFAFVLATEALFYLIKRKSFPAKSFRKFLKTAVIVLLSFLPWLLYVYSLGTASNTRPNLAVPSSGDLFNTYAQFIFGFQVDFLNTVIVSTWPLLVLLAFFALQKNRQVPSEAIFFVMAAVVPVFAAFLVSITLQPFFLSRYLIVAIPPLFIFLSYILAGYPLKVRRVLKGTLVVLIAITLTIQILSPNTPVKENYEEAVQYLNQNVSSQDVVIAAAPFTIYPIEYYYQGGAKVTTQPVWDRFSQGPIPPFNEETLAEDTERITAPYQNAWLVLSFDQGYNDDLQNFYDNNYQRLEAREFSPNLVVYKYKIRFDDPVLIAPPQN